MNAIDIETITAGHNILEMRRASLVRAIELGADEATLVIIRDALRVARRDYIVLPSHRYESLSRGRGWARSGKGNSATWGERVDDGYKVGPGRWSVGATDGFSRKLSVDWTVKHVQVGAEIWTVAS